MTQRLDMGLCVVAICQRASGTVSVFQGSFGAAGEFAGQSDLITVELPIVRSLAQEGLVSLLYGTVP